MENTESPQPSIGGEKKQDNPTTLDVHQKETIRKTLVETAKNLIGVPYIFGAEWTNYAQKPEALDCSEMVEGIYRLNGLKMPDGSQNQFDFTQPTGDPKPGDLAFFGRGGQPTQVYHVGMVYSEIFMIEARGFDPKSSFETGKVILRERERWEGYCNFLGYRTHGKLA